MSHEESQPLVERSCVPCRGGVPSLTEEERAPLLAQLTGWEVKDGHHLFKQYRFDDFVSGLAFVNRVGELAEREGHHPEITVGWGHVDIVVFTHKIDGLTESDFVLAARCDTVL